MRSTSPAWRETGTTDGRAGPRICRVPLWRSQGERDPRHRARPARPVQRCARRGQGPSGLLLQPFVLVEGKARRTQFGGQRRRPGASQLSRTADREAPHAGDFSHQQPVRGTLEEGEPPDRGDGDQRDRARPGDRRQVGAEVERQTGKEVELTSRVDESIIGGLVLQVGNMVLDTSIQNNLEKLRQSVARAA